MQGATVKSYKENRWNEIIVKVIGEKKKCKNWPYVNYTIFKLKNSELVNATYPVYTDFRKIVFRDGALS